MRFRQIGYPDLNFLLSFRRHIRFNRQYSLKPAARGNVLHIGDYLQAESGFIWKRHLCHVKDSIIVFASYYFEGSILIISDEHLSGSHSLVGGQPAHDEHFGPDSNLSLYGTVYPDGKHRSFGEVGIKSNVPPVIPSQLVIGDSEPVMLSVWLC